MGRLKNFGEGWARFGRAAFGVNRDPKPVPKVPDKTSPQLVDVDLEISISGKVPVVPGAVETSDG